MFSSEGPEGLQAKNNQGGQASAFRWKWLQACGISDADGWNHASVWIG
jgi:hypothetical protein